MSHYVSSGEERKAKLKKADLQKQTEQVRTLAILKHQAQQDFAKAVFLHLHSQVKQQPRLSTKWLRNS